MQLEVAVIRADGVVCRTFTAAEGIRAREVLAACSVEYTPETGLSVFGRRIDPDAVLADGDRLEAADPLICDPKALRSERALRQGDIRVVTCGRHGGRRTQRG